jgi:thiamine-monophosphate kinase
LVVAVALTGSESMEWITELARGIKFEADLAGAHVVGGDISRAGQLVISITAIGSTNKPITRGGAKSGDGIYLSSLTGWSAAGLALLGSGVKEDSKHVQTALSEFKAPTIDYGFDASKSSALCDVSDALVIQSAQMAEASKVCFNFDLTKIQASVEFAELEKVAQKLNLDVWSWIFAGGEDHALLATGSDLPGLLIGEVTEGTGLVNVPAGVEAKTWQHF